MVTKPTTLPDEESARLRSQDVTLKTGRGQHRKYLPYAFTEQGVAMLSSVLHSQRAVMVNIEVVRAFVRLRQMLASNADLTRKLAALREQQAEAAKLDAAIAANLKELSYGI